MGGGGGGSTGGQILADFNNYCASKITPVTEIADITLPGTNPYPFTRLWTVAKGSFASWQVTVTTTGSYYHITITGTTGNQIHNYILYSFSTNPAVMSGGNGFTGTSTWTQTNSNSPDKDKVLNNNTANVSGIATVSGEVKHVANFTIPIPPPLSGSIPIPPVITQVNNYMLYVPK